MAFKTDSGSSGPGLRAAGETLVIDPDLDENGLYCWATYLAYIQGAFSSSPESLASSLADSNRLTYTGHEFDPATGLYYFKARFYDPEIGRFLSEDPYLGDAATPPSLHRFLDAYSNPLRFIDPTGQSTIHYTDRQAIAGKPVSPPSQWGAPSDLTTSEAEVHYDLRQLYGQKTRNLADQYQVVTEKIQEKQTKYLATLVLDDDDFDQAGNPRLEKIYGEFIAVTGKYANSIVDLKEKLSQAIRQGGRVLDISELFSDAYECSTALMELTADRVATGFGPVGSIQRQASYMGQAGMAPEYTATKGVANLTAETAGWASLGLGAYRAGKISLELIQAARALPGEGNLITKIGRLLQNQSTGQTAEDFVTWVDEGGNLRTGGSPGMRPDAYDFQSGSPGARSNPVTGRGQAPYLQFQDDTGRVIGAKFDGVRGTELINRKLNPVFSPKAVDQASRQIAVAKHFGLQVVWEMPNQGAVDAALRFLRTNNFCEISVRLAK